MDATPDRGLQVQLKSLGQALGIKNRLLRYVVDSGLVPGLKPDAPGHFVPREFTEEETILIAIAAILHDHGFHGHAATEFVRRAKAQLNEGKNLLVVDYRGAFPVQLRLPLEELVRRLRNHKRN